MTGSVPPRLLTLDHGVGPPEAGGCGPLVTGSVPPGSVFFFFCYSCFDPLLAKEEGRVGLFKLGSPPQQRLVYTGPATQLCTTVAPAAQPKTRTRGSHKKRGKHQTTQTFEPTLSQKTFLSQNRPAALGSGEWLSPLQDATRGVLGAPPGHQGVPAPDAADPDAAAAQRGEHAARLAGLGKMSATAAALTVQPLAPGTLETLRELRDFARRPPSLARPSLQPPSPLVLNSARLVSKLRNAPLGPSGATAEHYRILLDDEKSISVLARAKQAFARADVPAEISEGCALAAWSLCKSRTGGRRALPFWARRSGTQRTWPGRWRASVKSMRSCWTAYRVCPTCKARGCSCSCAPNRAATTCSACCPQATPEGSRRHTTEQLPGAWTGERNSHCDSAGWASPPQPRPVSRLTGHLGPTLCW